MKVYAVVENCQEGIERECGFAKILGIFLIGHDNKEIALEKAEKCLLDRYHSAVDEHDDGKTEMENEPSKDENGMLTADWVCSGNDTYHEVYICEHEVTE